MSENPPPYGNDREDFEQPAEMPVPPEMEAPAAPLPPEPKKSNSPFMVSFILTTVVCAIPVLGFLAGPICILVGLIGAGTAKSPSSRASFGGVAAGGAVGMVVGAGICIALASNSGGF